MLSRWVPGVATALLATLLLGCSGTTVPEDDPAGALRTAFETLATYDGIGLTATASVSDHEDAVDVGRSLTSPAAAFELRSHVTRAAHLRALHPADGDLPQLVGDTAEQLRKVGLSPIADALEGGGWIRIATDALGDTGEDSDRLARALGAAGTRLLDGDAAVASLGDGERGHHLRITTDASAARRFVDDVAAAIADPGHGSSTRSRAADDAADGQVSLDVWLADGALIGVRIDLPAVLGTTAVPLVVDATVTPGEATTPVPDDAPPVAVASLVDAFSADTTHEQPTPPDDGGPAPPGASSPDGASSDGDPAGDDGVTGSPTPDTRPSDPPQLRDGGVLEEVFGDGEAFVEGEPFDCVTEADLDLFEAQLGTEARAELEELVTAGYVARC